MDEDLEEEMFSYHAEEFDEAYQADRDRIVKLPRGWGEYCLWEYKMEYCGAVLGCGLIEEKRCLHIFVMGELIRSSISRKTWESIKRQRETLQTMNETLGWLMTAYHRWEIS